MSQSCEIATSFFFFFLAVWLPGTVSQAPCLEKERSSEQDAGMSLDTMATHKLS